MKFVIFYLHATGLCGGIRVVLEYVTRLNALPGWRCELWTPPAPPASWFGKPVPHRVFKSLDELGNEARKTRAHKVATWWETAFWVAETIQEDGRGFYLTQDIETTYSGSQVQTGRILSTYQLGLTPLPTSRWVEGQLENMPGCVKPRFVGLGIDRAKFQELPMVRERYRILCPYRPGAGPRDLKGWNAARMAADTCRGLVPETSLVTFGIEGAPRNVPEGLPHIHVNRGPDLKLRELYSQSGVFLLPSNHEGLGLTALEAMACGCPVVSTNCNGNMEFCVDGETAMIAPVGDGKLLGELCAKVMRDDNLARKIARNGREISSRYTWDAAINRLANAVSG